jgi:hypothetical protein
MKRFLLNIFKLIGLFIIIIGAIFMFFCALIKKRAFVKTDKNTKYIVLGHSHPECAYNDTFINGLSNYASSGESYFYSYYKSKLIAENTNNITTVFIEFTNNQITETMDEWIWGSKYLNERFVFYAPFITGNDYKLLATKNSNIFTETLPYFIKKNAYYFTVNNYNYNRLGKYLYLVRDKTDSLLADTNSKSTVSKNNVSEMHLKYLERLIAFWKSKNVSVYLIRSPLHKMYDGYQNEQFYQSILKERFKNTPYLDFSKFPLLNSDFGDLEHLNYRGAKKYSNWFNKILNESSIFNNINKQQLIDSAISSLYSTNAK